MDTSCYSDDGLFFESSNCLNNTLLPLGQILIETIQYQIFRTNNKILVSADSNIAIPDLLDDKNTASSSISGNSYLIVHDRCNWYHFVMDTIIPLYQILASNRTSIDNIIIPLSLYDNQNGIQLLKTFFKISSDLRFIKLENSLGLQNVCWSTITYPDDSHLNCDFLQVGRSWSAPIISEFSQFIKSSIILNNNLSYPKIYLKRSRSLRRECINIDEVESLLVNTLGFQPVELEKFSFHDQVSILNNCDFIVGPSGAAWTNIIFCDSEKCVKAICWGMVLKHINTWQPLANSANVELTKIFTTNPHSYRLCCNDLSENISALLKR